MSTITATPDTTRAQVRLDIDFSDVNAAVVAVTRTNLVTGVVTTLRYTGSSVSGTSTALAGRLVVYDTEVPLDVPVRYTATNSALVPPVAPTAILNSNPYFENARITPWVGSNNVTMVASTTQAHSGLYSLRLVGDGVTAGPTALSEEVAAVAGLTYSVSGWMWSTLSSTTRRIGINWYDGTHAFLSGSFVTPSISATTWTKLTGSFAAPANTAFAKINTSDTGTPVNTNFWYVDEVTLSVTVLATATSSVVIVAGNGYGWLKDPVRPANSIRLEMDRPALSTRTRHTPGVAYLGLGDQVSAANMTLFNINNSAYPVAVTRVREAVTTSIKLFARTPDDVSRMETLLANGSAVMLQLPAAYSEPDRYSIVGNTTKSPVFVDQRRPGRLFSFPLATVTAPAGPSQGAAGVRWTDLCAHVSSWGALLANGGGTFDSFSRTVAAGGWGAPEVLPAAGAAWSVSGTAADFSVNGSVGQAAISVVNTRDEAIVSASSAATVELYFSCVIPVLALTQPIRVMATVRRADASNYYALGIEFQTSGVIKYMIIKRSAGTDTILTQPTGPAYAAGQTWRVHLSANGTTLAVSAWLDGTVEPVEFSTTTTDGTITAANPYGIMTMLNTGNTNTLPVTISFDNFQVKGTQTWQGVLDGGLG